MDLLLDTHTFLWFVWDAPDLSPDALQLIEDPANRKRLSIASCWELAIKAGLGKIKFDLPVGDFLNREILLNHFDLLPVELAHVARVEVLPPHHKDPFDRLLAAQALSEDLRLVSADNIFDLYGVQRNW